MAFTSRLFFLCLRASERSKETLKSVLHSSKVFEMRFRLIFLSASHVIVHFRVVFHVRNLYRRALAPWEAPQQGWGTWVPVVLCSPSCDLEQVTSPAWLGLFIHKGKDCESVTPRCHRYWSQETHHRGQCHNHPEPAPPDGARPGGCLSVFSISSVSLSAATVTPLPELWQQLPLVHLCPHPNASVQQSESLLKVHLTTSVHFF